MSEALEKFRSKIVGYADEDPEQLLANPANWRVHPDEQRRVLEAALGDVGWIAPVIVNRLTGHVVDGHLRVDVALKHNLSTIPVVYVELTEAEEAEALATLDTISAQAGTDKDKLRELAAGLTDASSPVRELLERVSGLSNALKPAPEETELVEASGEVLDRWGVKLGQVWQVGKHRIACGDCANPKVVAALMGGETADAVLTDPPYGQDQPGVPGDSPESLRGLLRGMLAALPMKVGVLVAFQSPRTFPTLLAELPAAGLAFERMLWLYKSAQCTFPWRGWILKSEAIVVAAKGEGAWFDAHPYAHDTYSLAEVNGELGDTPGWHGSVKPAAVVSDIAQRICPPGALIFEPFLGSGTTLMATEAAGRRCYATEITPEYVAVALERAARAGLEPRLME